MTNQRRPGFRLPWAGAEPETDSDASEQPQDVTETTAAAEAPPATPGGPSTEATETTQAKSAEAPTAAIATDATTGPSATDATPPSAAGATAAANPFLRSLVDAMRGVAEEARTTSLTELKAKVEQRVEHVGATGAELAEDLRRRSELDIKGIGDWERGEVERIRGEAARKVEARRQQLEQQLVERQQQTEHEIEATRGRLADYERELASFVAELAEIEDPAVFVDAARRMPRQPSLELTHSAEAKPAAAPEFPQDETLTARLAKLGVAGNGNAGPDQADGTSSAVSSNGHRPAGEDANATTAIVVKGLGSFGAITSFKQSLEKSVGIRAVSLSLGPTGEFVYRATHEPSFDIEAAIREAESGAASIERQSDGTVRVNVVRAR